MSKPSIRSARADEAHVLLRIIQTAFYDTAQRLRLTPASCPRFPAFASLASVVEALGRGPWFVAELDGQPVGCVGLYPLDANRYELKRLAVLPAYRGRGCGSALVRYALAEAERRQAVSVDLGMLAENTSLQRWYERFGFFVVGKKEFSHLPFTVAYMSTSRVGAVCGVHE